MWLKADGFVGLVKQWWDSYSFQGTPSYVLACKLKALKQNLKIWNEEVFGNVERNKRKLFEELQAFDTIEGSRVREVFSFGGGELEAEIEGDVVKGRGQVY